MRRRAFGLALAVGLTIAACGDPDRSAELPADADQPVIQVTSEGGFAPVEYILAQGPRYTLLADGRLISEGPQIAIYPGPLLPNYMVTQVNEDQMNTVLDLVDEMGLADIEEEIDDSLASMVADATTEVVTYWDLEGTTHRYGVYALGLEPLEDPASMALADLLVVLDQLAASEAVSYEGERVRVVGGMGFTDPDFVDIREWPLPETDFSDWTAYPNGWMCQVYRSDVLPAFEDASQVTQWTPPGDNAGSAPLSLVVRPLHPGEPDCHQPE